MEMAVVISMRQRKKSLSIYWEPNQIVINVCITKYIVISVTLEKKNLESKTNSKKSESDQEENHLCSKKKFHGG